MTVSLPTPVKKIIDDTTVFSLAYGAGVTAPSTADSVGAKMLMSVLASVVEAVEYLDSLDDAIDADALRDALDGSIHEVADGAPAVYTHERWAQFVDLAAYLVDLSDYDLDLTTKDLTDVAGMALYCVARDVADYCVTLIGDAMSEHVTSAIDAASTVGADEGKNAADWWAQDTMGGRAPSDAAVTARAVLAGIADGDPEILDSLPAADLSGQFADRSTLVEVLAVLDLDGFDVAGQVASEVLDAFTQGYDAAVEAHLTSVAQSVINAAD